jgi:two-component sensor histidine kinase
MSFPRLAGLLALLWLLVASLSSRAEPIRPRLPQSRFDSLRARLPGSRPDTSRVLLLLQLGQDLLAQSDDLGTEASAALPYAQQAAALSDQLHFAAGRIGSLYLLGQVHDYVGQDTLGPGLIRQGLALSIGQNRPRLAAFGWLWLGETKAQAPAQIACFQRARALFKDVGDQADEAYVLKAIADCHLGQGHPEQALGELREVLALYRAAGHRRLYYTHDLLQATYRQLGDYKEALRYGLMALAGAEAAHDANMVGALHVRLAVLYRDLRQYPEALVYYQKALAGFQQQGNALSAITMAGAIVRIRVAQHRAQEGLDFFMRVARPYAHGSPRVVERIADYLVEAHLALGHYAQAAPYAAQLVAFLQTGTAGEGEKAAIYLILGRFYVLTKRYDEARRYLQLAQSQQRGTLLYVAELHLLLFKADSAQGRFPAAIRNYQRYKLLTDSVFNEKKNQQLASLQMQYDTRRKEQNIALLTRQTQAQQASLRQRDWQRNALLAGAALLALLLGLGYNRYRLKQRATRLLQAQQQEINRKNESLQALVHDKQHLLEEKQDLLEDKEALLVEKDWMLKEIHHRVKNNLQVISSLLNTQADYLSDPAALAALREGQNRVQAMALVHQKLYQSDSLALVNMPEYIQEITERLLESFDCLGTVREHLDVAPIELDVALATPLGLLINEAVTNALKHAFPPPRTGTLTIGLHAIGPQRYELLIADNGVGLPANFDLAHSQTLGLTMVKGLSKQLNGVLHIGQVEPGTQLTLQFEVARKTVRTEPVLA